MSSTDEKQRLIDKHASINDGDAAKPSIFKKGVALVKKQLSTCNVRMLGLLGALILIATANRVAFKVMTNALSFNARYLTFINELVNIAYMIVFWPISWYLILFTKQITPEMRAFPVWKYIVMGAFDAIASILMIFGGSRTSGPMQQLLLQGNLLFTMLFSFFMTFTVCTKIVGSRLTVKYKWTHLLGAGLIVGGLAMALAPKLADPSQNQGNDIGANILFFISDVPTAMSGVYKEIAFRGTSLNVMMTNAWVATWQFVATIPITPLSSIPSPLLGNDTYIPIQELPAAFWNGALCYFNQPNIPDDPLQLCIQNMVWLRVTVYLVINIFYNIFILLVIKYGSAALLYVSSAMLLPLANICFTQPWIMNFNGQDFTGKLTGFDIGGLVLIVVGLIFYRVLPEGDETEDQKTADLETHGEETKLLTDETKSQ